MNLKNGFDGRLVLFVLYMKEIDCENEAGQIMLQLRFTLHSDVYFMPSVLYK